MPVAVQAAGSVHPVVVQTTASVQPHGILSAFLAPSNSNTGSISVLQPTVTQFHQQGSHQYGEPSPVFSWHPINILPGNFFHGPIWSSSNINPTTINDQTSDTPGYAVGGFDDGVMISHHRAPSKALQGITAAVYPATLKQTATSKDTASTSASKSETAIPSGLLVVGSAAWRTKLYARLTKLQVKGVVEELQATVAQLQEEGCKLRRKEKLLSLQVP